MSSAFDLIVVGSGAAGLATAIRAHDLGARVLVLEADAAWGGSTAISGGVVWIPDNPQMAGRGVPDSREEALTYLTHITAGAVPPERLAAYVDHAPRVLQYLGDQGHVHLDALEMYSDYYAEAPGGKPGGRSMEPVPYDARGLGPWFLTLQRSHPQSQIMGLFGITAREAKDYLVPGFFGTLKLISRFVQYALRAWARRGLPRDTKLHAGNALAARLMRSVLDRKIEVRLSAPVEALLRDGDRVTGVRVGGQELTAAWGVALCAGGFERSEAMRALHQPQASTDWNAGNLRNQGDGIRMGAEAGAALDLMDEAWWTPVTRLPRSDKAWVLVVEKSLPGGIFVNRHGERFCNEAGPYLDVGKTMFDHDAAPVAFLLFDARFRRSYPVGPIAPGYAQPDSSLSRRLREEFLIKADSIEALAGKCGLDPAAVARTVARFNEQAAQGTDPDFGRGETLSDRYYADERVGKNPCLTPLVKPPFYAIRIYPGDLGTKGGVVTDAGGRALRPDGTPIPGLYAAGNNTSAVMGRTYPGAGGTIGPAMVFGFLSAESAAADRKESP